MTPPKPPSLVRPLAELAGPVRVPPMRPSTAALASVIVLLTVLIGACGKRSNVPPVDWQPDRSCNSSDECRPVEGCCPAPCTSLVINARDVDAMRRRIESECTSAKRAECPSAGACLEHRYLCVRGQCAIVFAGSADWPTDAGTR